MNLKEIFPPMAELTKVEPIFAFLLVEKHFEEGGSWEEVEAAMQATEGFSDPMGPLGPLWIAVQLHLGRPAPRAAREFVEIAKDVLHNLRKFGKMKAIELPPKGKETRR